MDLFLTRYLQGKTKDQAFRIGNDIADTVTALNPSPVKLKFEKVSNFSLQFLCDHDLEDRCTIHVCSWLRNDTLDLNMNMSMTKSLYSTQRASKLYGETVYRLNKR
jgi:hypothetical protein